MAKPAAAITSKSTQRNGTAGGGQKITPNIWFDDQAEEAARFYCSIFKDSKILHIARYGDAAAKAAGRPKGSVLTVAFKIFGQEFVALNGGPVFKLSEAVSFIVNCDDQKEVDTYWKKLTAGGGEESVCGWLKDKFGLSWQVVPRQVNEMMQGEPKKAERMMAALLQMKKLDLKGLEAAYRSG